MRRSKKVLTDRDVKALRARRAGEAMDGLAVELGARATETGRCFFFLRYGPKGAQRRMTLGEYPAMRLEAARDRARAQRSQVQAGAEAKNGETHRVPLSRQAVAILDERWAFTDRNAGSFLAESYADLFDLDKINWSAVAGTNFSDQIVKEGKQAEFLVHGSFPWRLVDRIGVQSAGVEAQVQAALRRTDYQPLVRIERAWYY